MFVEPPEIWSPLRTLTLNLQTGQNKNIFIRLKKTEYESAKHLLTVKDLKQRQILIKHRTRDQKKNQTNINKKKKFEICHNINGTWRWIHSEHCSSRRSPPHSSETLQQAPVIVLAGKSMTDVTSCTCFPCFPLRSFPVQFSNLAWCEQIILGAWTPVTESSFGTQWC